MCITFEAAETSECCAAVDELASEVKRLKHQGEQLKQQGELLGSEVERLKHLLTPRSSFIPTGNRTMPAWGKSVYSRCQLLFSWTELNKVRYYPIVSPFFVFHTSRFMDDSYLFTILSLSSYSTFFVFMFHYLRGTKSVKLYSGLVHLLHGGQTVSYSLLQDSRYHLHKETEGGE